MQSMCTPGHVQSPYSQQVMMPVNMVNAFIVINLNAIVSKINTIPIKTVVNKNATTPTKTMSVLKC